VLLVLVSASRHRAVAHAVDVEAGTCTRARNGDVEVGTLPRRRLRTHLPRASAAYRCLETHAYLHPGSGYDFRCGCACSRVGGGGDGECESGSGCAYFLPSQVRGLRRRRCMCARASIRGTARLGAAVGVPEGQGECSARH
jgi:hypothetical protein